MCDKSFINLPLLLVLIMLFQYHDIVTVASVSQKYTFRSEGFIFNDWRSSLNGFPCPTNISRSNIEDYTLLCNYDLNIMIEQIMFCQRGELQTANRSKVVTVSVVAIETIILVGLLTYVCKLRKKVKKSYDQMEIRKSIHHSNLKKDSKNEKLL